MSPIATPSPRTLVLASSSPYRRELLSRLRLPFVTCSPDLDESPLPGEAPEATSVRLAREKACRGAQWHPEAWIIGSDQVAVCQGQSLGKPGTHAQAVQQLQATSGQEVLFHTAVCLWHAPSAREWAALATVTVRYRTLAPDAIERYLAADQPYDCAGSARIEALGITLVEWVRSDDPTALVGLPLIALSRLLRAAGWALP